MSSAEAPAVAPASSAEAKQTKRNQQKKAPSIRYPFWFGGSASSMAACVTHPLDLGMSQSSLPASLPWESYVLTEVCLLNSQGPSANAQR